MNKKYFLVIVINFLSIVLSAQVVDSANLPPYLKTRQVPPYKVRKMDSTTFHYKYQLAKNTNTVIIYFSPDCEHCKTEAKSIVDSLGSFKNTQFLFASYAPFDEVKKFAIEYKLLNQPNIIVGRDDQYFIPRFFKVKYTPFVAVYNKDGELLRAYEGGATVKKLVETIGE